VIGNRVEIVVYESEEATLITGTLHQLDSLGAVIWRENAMPEQQCNVFIPMHRIHEIVDLGRAP
jgi:hypothetical protein